MERELNIEVTIDPYALYADSFLEDQESLIELIYRDEVSKICADIERRDGAIRRYSDC